MSGKPIELSDGLKALAERIEANQRAKGQWKETPQRAPVRPVYDGICLKGWDCDICGGSGYYRLDVEPGHKEFGKLHRCSNVDLTKLAGFERLGLHPKEVSFSWDKIQTFGGDESAWRAGQDVKQFMAERESGWIYLHGSHGTAKSLILKIAVAQALRAGASAAYANMASILNFMRAAYDTRNPNWEAEERLEWLEKLHLLAIDEFDLIKGTDWESNQRFQLMDARYNGAILGEGFTLIASNRHPDQLPTWYQDRIYDGRFLIITLNGPSARRRMEPGIVG